MVNIFGEERGMISIHAPRVGSDLETGEYILSEIISIHAPRVGSDPTPV